MSTQPPIFTPFQKGVTREHAADYGQQPRNVTYSEIFWLNMSVPFTPVASEVLTAFTESEGFDCLVKGAWTDLTGARVRMVEDQTDRAWSSAQVPIRGIAGASNQVSPLVPLPQPVFLESRAQLRGDWINTINEVAGRVCFYTEKQRDPRNPQGGDGRVRVTRSMFFNLFIDLGQTSGSTDPVNSDCLIWGASTNCANSIIGRIFNETTNYAWSSVQIPIRAMAGEAGQVQPIMRYPKPYLLPNNVKLRAEINTAVTGNYIQFLVERILM